MNKRLLKYDAIRITAILLVVLVHVSAYVVLSFPDANKTEFIIGNIFNGLSRAGVPLFVMLSGALLLDENKAINAKSFYKKILMYMVFLLIGWMIFYGLFYSVILPLIKGSEISFCAFLDYIKSFKGSNYPHMWYMFFVVGTYLTIPVLRLFVKKENVKYIVGIVICALVFLLLKTLDVLTINSDFSFSDYFSKFHLESVTYCLGYLLLGWLLSSFELKKPFRILIYFVGISAFVLSTLCVQLFYNSIPTVRAYVYDQISLPACLFGIGAFEFILQACKNKTTKGKFVKAISKYSFGIYIIHVALLEIFVAVMPYSEKFPCGILCYLILLYIIIIASSALAVFIVSKIKYVKKIFYIK